MMDDLISRQALCDYALNQKDKSVTPNDIMRFPSAQPYTEAEIQKMQELEQAELQKAYECGRASAQPESTRTFVELVVEYPDPELCTYEKYKVKPYYSIKYIENGETYVGYGTYNPEVLSQYLNKYFIPSARQEIIHCRECRYYYFADNRCYGESDDIRWPPDGFCSFAERREDDDMAISALEAQDAPDTNVDTISRQAAIDEITEYGSENSIYMSVGELKRRIETLQPAQPEIIHCMDCKHSEHWYNKCRCFLWHEGGIDVFEDGFCNYAERRTDECTD